MYTKIKNNPDHTFYASYIGYICQAIVNNFVPLLFLTFQSEFHVTLDKIGLLSGLNFGVQLVTDLVASQYVDRIGYRKSIQFAHFCCGMGLMGLTLFSSLFSFYGICFSVVLYAIGGGLIEVLISPIVEACPSNKKAAAMSILHSFYCWGQVSVILFSTLFFFAFGIESWRILAILWSMIPFINMIYFSYVPIYTLVEEGEGLSLKQLLKNKLFFLFCFLMILAGACELSMAQWASAFVESGLHVSKSMGDLLGPCLFAVFMGLARVFYAKKSETISLPLFMFLSGLLGLISYLMTSLTTSPFIGLLGCGLCGLSVGILWPGTTSLASRSIPKGSTTLFAFLALSGDIGCSLGPLVVGMVANQSNLRIGLLVASIFPILLMISVYYFHKTRKKSL